MTQLRINNKSDFVNTFLSPISKLAENTVIKVRDKEIVSVSSSSDGTLIVNCTFKQENEVDETIFLNIPDINRLIKVLSCVETDDLNLLYDNNNIQYKSKQIGFKYHLLDDGIIETPSVDLNKIKSIDFSFRFKIDQQSINQLVKGSTFTTETDKIYFHVDDGNVMASLTDKQRHNVDCYTQCVAESYKGDLSGKELALSFETMRIISSIRFDDLIVNVNPELNVFLFQVETKSSTIIVVSSGYVG